MQHSLIRLWESSPEIVRNIISAIMVFFIFWLLARFIAFVACKLLKTHAPSVIKLVKNTLRKIILIIGFIAALGAAGVNVSMLIASAGLMGFAAGYALKDLLGNVISGALLLFNKTIKKGDRIAISSFEGTVEKIELRCTTLKNDNQIYLVPNNKLFTNILTVFPKKG